MTEVDLLPAVDLGTRTKKGSRKKIFKQMKEMTLYDRSFYSVSFAKDQVQFVDQAPKNVKDLIRLVKHWKKREDINLISYCIELIVIKQWQEGRLKGLDLTQRFKQVLGQISNLGTMQITWPSRYKISLYRDLPASPVVMDPANPFINTAEWVSASDVCTMKSKATDILKRLT